MFLCLGRSWHHDPTSCYYPSIALGSQMCTVCNLYVHRIAKVPTLVYWNTKSYQQWCTWKDWRACGHDDDDDANWSCKFQCMFTSIPTFVVENSHTNLAIARVNFLSKAINLSDQFHEKGNKPSNELDHQWHCRRVKQKSIYKTEMHPPVVLSSSSLELTQSMLYDSVLFFSPDKFCHFLQKNIANFVEKWVLLVKILLILLFLGKRITQFSISQNWNRTPWSHPNFVGAFTTVFFHTRSQLTLQYKTKPFTLGVQNRGRGSVTVPRTKRTKRRSWIDSHVRTNRSKSSMTVCELSEVWRI